MTKEEKELTKLFAKATGTSRKKTRAGIRKAISDDMFRKGKPIQAGSKEVDFLKNQLSKEAKSLLVKNPNMTKTALKTALRVGTKAIPATLAASLIAEVAMYAYKNRTTGSTTDPAARKRSRHGKKSSSSYSPTAEQALAAFPPKKKESTRKKTARRQGRGMAHGGAVKSYATQNKRYGGGVYPKVGS